MMGFNRTIASNQQAKRALPRIQSTPKNREHCDKFSLQDRNASLAHIQRKKQAIISPESEVETVKNLSSDGDLMYHPSSDDSQGNFLNRTLSKLFSSTFSISGSYDSNFDGSKLSPIDEASLVFLDEPWEDSIGGDSSEEVAIWLHNSVRNKINYSAGCSESDNSSYDRSFFDDSSIFESSSTSLSTQEDTDFFVQNFDRTGIWVSSLDLNIEDSELIVQSKDQGFDIFDSDFPSPTFSAKQKHNSDFSSSTSVTSFEQSDEIENSSEACDSDGPLFWPFVQKSYCLPEFEESFFGLSPPKSEISFRAQNNHSLKPDRSRVQKNSFTARKNRREECRRKLVFDASLDQNIQDAGMIPSRGSRSSQAFLNKRPSNILISEKAHSQGNFLNRTLSKLFSSTLSVSGSYDLNFDGSRLSPIDEASLVFLDEPLEDSIGGDSSEEVAIWLQNSVINEINYSAGCSESDNSSYDRSFFDDSSIFESSSTSLSTQEDTDFFVQNFDRTGIWVSSLDLNIEDSELIVQSKDQEFDIFDSDFPSPTFSAKQKHNSDFSSSTSVTSFEQSDEIENSSEACDSDGPLFWPFDQKSYSLPEFEESFLCLSPPKSEISFRAQNNHSLKPDRSRVQKNSFTARKNRREECRRKLVFDASLDQNIQDAGMIPSRGSRSSQAFLNKSPPNILISEKAHLLHAKNQQHVCDDQLLDTPLLELEATDFQLVGEVSIEEMVGLTEFDGHEGLMGECEEGEYTLQWI